MFQEYPNIVVAGPVPGELEMSALKSQQKWRMTLPETNSQRVFLPEQVGWSGNFPMNFLWIGGNLGLFSGAKLLLVLGMVLRCT